jgi:hypothetical protein
MPIEQGVGTSEHTKNKQEVLQHLLKMHLKICRGIFSNYNIRQPYYYIDMNAAHGAGSPTIFHTLVTNEITIPYHALLVERDTENAVQLARCFQNEPHVTVKSGDHDDIVPAFVQSLKGKPYGLCYHDPNGEVSWNTLANIARLPASNHIDILIHFTATGHKRIAKATGRLEKIMEYVQQISKKYWIVRKPDTNCSWQWTFLIGSNWDGFPDWKKQHFHRLREEEGQEIMKKLMHTKEEWQKLHQLSFLDEL